MLGDLGGLIDALVVIGWGFLGIFQFQVFENYLVSLLYKEQKAIASNQLDELDDILEQDDNEIIRKSETMIAEQTIRNRHKLKTSKIWSYRELLQHFFPKLLVSKCCQ